MHMKINLRKERNLLHTKEEAKTEITSILEGGLGWTYHMQAQTSELKRENIKHIYVTRFKIQIQNTEMWTCKNVYKIYIIYTNTI